MHERQHFSLNYRWIFLPLILGSACSSGTWIAPSLEDPSPSPSATTVPPDAPSLGITPSSPTPGTPGPVSTPEDSSPTPFGFPTPGGATPVPGHPEFTPIVAPTAAPPDPPSVGTTSLVLVSDTPSTRISVLRMSDSSIIWDYYFAQGTTTNGEVGPPEYQVHDAKYVVHSQVEYIDFVSTLFSDEASVFHRIRVDDKSEVFQIGGLDFTGIPNPTCTVPASDSCRGSADLPVDCLVRFVHGYEIVEDDPVAQRYTAVIADHQGKRIVSATLDYANGNRCARVNWVLDDSSPEWEPTCAPNGLHYMTVDGTQYMLVTCRNLLASISYGQLHFFKQSPQGAWTRAWTFPDPTSSSEPYLNVPHGGNITPRDEGGYWLLYAHSDGLADEWSMGGKGTIGSAVLPTLEAQPEFLAEEAPGASLGETLFGCVKSIELLPDGSRLMTDFGSYSNPRADQGSHVYLLAPQEVVDDASEGYFTPDHSQQNLHDISDSVEQVVECQWDGLFVAAWLDPTTVGPFLSDAMRASPGTVCSGGSRQPSSPGQP